jgi:hypothetical protein
VDLQRCCVGWAPRACAGTIVRYAGGNHGVVRTRRYEVALFSSRGSLTGEYVVAPCLGS